MIILRTHAHARVPQGPTGSHRHSQIHTLTHRMRPQVAAVLWGATPNILRSCADEHTTLTHFSPDPIPNAHVLPRQGSPPPEFLDLARAPSLPPAPRPSASACTPGKSPPAIDPHGPLCLILLSRYNKRLHPPETLSCCGISGAARTDRRSPRPRRRVPRPTTASTLPRHHPTITGKSGWVSIHGVSDGSTGGATPCSNLVGRRSRGHRPLSLPRPSRISRRQSCRCPTPCSGCRRVPGGQSSV